MPMQMPMFLLTLLFAIDCFCAVTTQLYSWYVAHQTGCRGHEKRRCSLVTAKPSNKNLESMDSVRRNSLSQKHQRKAGELTGEKRDPRNECCFARLYLIKHLQRIFLLLVPQAGTLQNATALSALHRFFQHTKKGCSPQHGRESHPFPLYWESAHTIHSMQILVHCEEDNCFKCQDACVRQSSKSTCAATSELLVAQVSSLHRISFARRSLYCINRDLLPLRGRKMTSSTPFS